MDYVYFRKCVIFKLNVKRNWSIKKLNLINEIKTKLDCFRTKENT